jgi:cytochrome c biogenesis protein CcdA
LEKVHPGADIVRLNLLNSEAAQLNKGLCMDLGLPEHKHGLAPSVFAADGALVDREITYASLNRLAASSAGQPVPWKSEQALQQRGEGGMERTVNNLTLLVVVGAGLADGVNPCAFAVIIFFLTYMAYVGKGRKEIVLAGIIYTAAVFLTYLAIGIGLHQLLEKGLGMSTLLRRIIYGAMTILLVVAALLSVRDGIHCLRGETDRVTLKLPDAVKRRIHLHMTRQTRRGLTVVGALSLGVVVAVLEFPCTGQTYVPIITYLSVNPVGAFAWLVLYNLCFILPLVVVFLCILFGTSSEEIKTVFQRNMATAKFALATVFAALAAVLFLTMP